MKNKAILVSFIALLAIAFALNTVIASDFVSVEDVIVNDISVKSFTSVGKVSDVVPVEVKFSAAKDVDEIVKIRIYIEGYKDEISESAVLRTPLKEGVTYIERFTLKLPSTFDLDDPDENLTVRVRFSAKGEDSVEEEYSLVMQKDLYSLNVLSIEASEEEAFVGKTFAVDVVVENNGHDRLDNVYVRASIPELGVSKKIYLGDLDPDVDETYDETRDTLNKKVYLTVPKTADPGRYELVVEAYNYDTGIVAKKFIEIRDIETGILPTMTAKTVAVGQETTFSVVLVNPNDRMVVYSITPGESKGLIVEVEEPVVTVGADSSKTVNVKVKATESAEEGTHVVTLNVNSESGLEKQVSLTVNVEKSSGVTTVVGKSNAVMVLTIVLVIIFVVLLIVLIVLLTKRPEEETEEFGETSYY